MFRSIFRREIFKSNIHMSKLDIRPSANVTSQDWAYMCVIICHCSLQVCRHIQQCSTYWYSSSDNTAVLLLLLQLLLLLLLHATEHQEQCYGCTTALRSTNWIHITRCRRNIISIRYHDPMPTSYKLQLLVIN